MASSSMKGHRKASQWMWEIERGCDSGGQWAGDLVKQREYPWGCVKENQRVLDLL